MIIDPRESKLPKWAQEALNRGRQAEAALAVHDETSEKSGLWYGRYDNPIYIPEPAGQQSVVWKMGDRDHRFEQIMVRRNGQSLLINGGMSIIIEPSASNTINVRLDN
jgi:hypothetical protein